MADEDHKNAGAEAPVDILDTGEAIMARETIHLSRRHLEDLRQRAKSSREGIVLNAVPTVERILARTRGIVAGVAGEEMLDLVLLEWAVTRRRWGNT